MPKVIPISPPGKSSSGDPFFDELARRVAEKVIETIDLRGGLGAGQPVPRLAWTLKEFGYAIGRSEPVVRKLIELGMPHFRLGASLRVCPAEAIDWVKANGAYLDGGEP